MSGTGALPISDGSLALSALLIGLNLALSSLLRLGLGRPLLLASTRMVVQLLLVGGVLEWLFRQQNPLPILGLGLVMACIAAAFFCSSSSTSISTSISSCHFIYYTNKKN